MNYNKFKTLIANGIRRRRIRSQKQKEMNVFLYFCVKKQLKKPLQIFKFNKINWRCDFMGNFLRIMNLIRKIFNSDV